ncbi:hypothetical protein GCM10023108_14570 [Saccharopolyspora hordei]
MSEAKTRPLLSVQARPRGGRHRDAELAGQVPGQAAGAGVAGEQADRLAVPVRVAADHVRELLRAERAVADADAAVRQGVHVDRVVDAVVGHPLREVAQVRVGVERRAARCRVAVGFGLGDLLLALRGARVRVAVPVRVRAVRAVLGAVRGGVLRARRVRAVRVRCLRVMSARGVRTGAGRAGALWVRCALPARLVRSR